MDKLILYNLSEVTKSAAMAAYSMLGRNDCNAVDEVAVMIAKSALANIKGCKFDIVAGEGERDNAPLLKSGEVIGDGSNAYDIAIDPVECTTNASVYANGSMSVLAVGEHKTLLKSPDVYMKKVVVGEQVPQDMLDLDAPIQDQITAISSYLGKNISDFVVCVLDRPRHKDIIQSVVGCGARIKLIRDGDIFGALSVGFDQFNVDMYYGIGGSPEGIIAAAALKNMQCIMAARFVVNNEQDKEKLNNFSINASDTYTTNTLCKGNTAFIATGITDGDILDGVHYSDSEISSDSIIISKYGIDRLNSSIFQNKH